jgi:hypothetical protein
MVLLARKRPFLAVCSFAAVANLALVALAERPAAAVLVSGFDGAFGPANWTPSANTTLDGSGAPGSLSITGIESGSNEEKFFSISIPLNSDQDSLSVLWNYSTEDLSPAFDIFGYLVNETIFVSISDPFGDTTQSGDFRIALSPSDTFSFAIRSIDDTGGTASISLFGFQAGLNSEVPDCPCVPGPLPVLGVVTAFRHAKRLRSKMRAAA